MFTAARFVLTDEFTSRPTAPLHTARHHTHTVCYSFRVLRRIAYEFDVGPTGRRYHSRR
jgi:hypothetical protein